MTYARGLPVACMALDPAHTVRVVNDECGRLLGYDPSTLSGRRLADLLPMAARAFFQTHVLPTLAQSGRVDEVYVSLRTASDESLPVVLNALASGDGGVEVSFMPMRRRHFFEREFVRARQEAERSTQGEADALRRVDAVMAQLAVTERLASIGTLAATVAHEVNNPLAYVSANVDLLAAESLGGPGLRGETAAILRDIQEGIARIREIVGSLKTLSRVDDTRRDPVDLGEVLEVALKITGVGLRHRARVEIDVEQPPPVVLGEQGRLGQVLINLLVNAAQALPVGREAENLVRVRIRRVELDRAEVEVSDNGPGIPPALHAKIFDPFFTTKAIGEGTGLGLSVCHGVVTSLGGTITLTSDEGEGARFVITLPAVPVVPAAPPRAPTPAPAPAVDATVGAATATPSLRVLLVDDDGGIGRVMGRMLRGHTVDWCASGEAAWERFTAGAFAEYDVILCDLMMPGMSGMDLYARVADAAPGVAARFVFLTGGAFHDKARDFLDRVGCRTLTKPFRIQELQAVVLEVARG